MKRWISERLDDAMLPFLKWINPGYADRIPQFRPASECDTGILGQSGPPDRVELRRVRRWMGCGCQQFTFRSPVHCLTSCSPMVSGKLITVADSAPWCLIVPGYATGAVPGSGYSFYQSVQARALVDRGINAALIDTPFHMSRRTPGCLSGEGFFSPDLQQTKLAVLQGAADVIAAVRWLHELSGQRPGVWGTSLGGCLAGLAGAYDEHIGGLVLMEPLDNPGDPLAVLPGAREIREAAANEGFPPEAIPTALQDVAPSSYRPALQPDAILFITPQWDRVVPLRFQEAFWQAWGRPTRIMVPQSHTTMADNRTLAARAAQFLHQRLTHPLH